MKRLSSATHLAQQVGLPKSRGLEAVMKAQLITAVLREVTRQQLTHTELAERTGLPRSAVTGILSGAYKKLRSIVSYGSSRLLGWNQRSNFDAQHKFVTGLERRGYPHPPPGGSIPDENRPISLRAYPNNPEARNAMRAQAKWRKAR